MRLRGRREGDRMPVEGQALEGCVDSRARAGKLVHRLVAVTAESVDFSPGFCGFVLCSKKQAHWLTEEREEMLRMRAGSEGVESVPRSP